MYLTALLKISFSLKMKRKSSFPFFLMCWLAAGGIIFAVHLLRDDASRRDITEGIGRGVVWGALIAAVPVAIQGSIRKARERKEKP